MKDDLKGEVQCNQRDTERERQRKRTCVCVRKGEDMGGCVCTYLCRRERGRKSKEKCLGVNINWKLILLGVEIHEIVYNNFSYSSCQQQLLPSARPLRPSLILLNV